MRDDSVVDVGQMYWVKWMFMYLAPDIGKPDMEVDEFGDCKKRVTTSVENIPFFIILRDLVAAPSSANVFEKGGIEPVV